MALVVRTWSYTGGQQGFTVPSGVSSAFFELWGAPGGHSAISTAGGTRGFSAAVGTYAYYSRYDQSTVQSNLNTKSLVGYVSGTLAVTAGTTYYLYVGGAGGIGNSSSQAFNSPNNYGPGGYNGGGAGGFCYPDYWTFYSPGGGGGGATDVRLGGIALANRILVAGGGGGGSWGSVSTTPQTAANPTTPDPPYPNSDLPGFEYGDGASYYQVTGPSFGGAGGGLIGQTGGLASNAANETVAGTGGTGGSQGAGGAAGSGSGGIHAGAAGALGVGGTGGQSNPFDWSTYGSNAGGGGGGGGYYGGGGGSTGLLTSSGTFTGGGGGGGSNYISGSFTGPQNFQHVMPGGASFPGINGAARITYTQPPNAPVIPSPVSGAFINAASALLVEWIFSSQVVGIGQGGFDVEYMVVGGSIWTLFANSTAGNINHFSIPAATFTAGQQYLVRVRVYDTDGDVSGWTTITINVINVAGAPTVTAPTTGAGISTTPFTVTWTVDGGAVETLYRVQALDANNIVQFDSLDKASSRVNLCANPGFETNTTGWTTKGGLTFAQSTTYAKFGTHSGKISWVNGVAPGSQGVLYAFTTIPGQDYMMSAYVTNATPGTDPNIQAWCLDSDAATQLGEPGTAFITVAGTFLRVLAAFTALSNTSYLFITPSVTPGASEVGFVDAVMIEEGGNFAAGTGNPTWPAFFDGANLNGNTGTNTWAGTANASQSILTVANVLSQSVAWPAGSGPITVSVTYATVADLGVFSPAGTSEPIVNLNPPATPTVALSIDNDTGSASLAITNAAGSFATLYNDIFRTDTTNGTPEIRIATGVTPNTTFTDYTPGTAVTYAYRVRAYSATGGFADAT